MSSLGEVQRIIGLSLSKIQMGRNQRGGLPLHKNLLVATVLNKARDVYMQETMYMNYRLMACGQFNQEDQEDMEDDDTPDTEDYEEDSESDVEDDNESSASKDYAKEFVGPSCVPSLATASTTTKVEADAEACAVTAVTSAPVTTKNSIETPPVTPCAITNDEGFIDESDCDCDARNFCEDGENRVPFQYCFSCAPFHPSNGRGPTLVGPQLPNSTTCAVAQPVAQEPEDKLIYDMDSKSTQNQSATTTTMTVKRKRQVSSEETEDAINSILPKKRRDSCASEGQNLDDSGFQEEDEKVTLSDSSFVYFFLSTSRVYTKALLDMHTNTNFSFRSFIQHFAAKVPTMEWRWIKSLVSFQYFLSASNYSTTQNQDRIPPFQVRLKRTPKKMTILTVTVIRAVIVVILVMITKQTTTKKQKKLVKTLQNWQVLNLGRIQNLN